MLKNGLAPQQHGSNPLQHTGYRLLVSCAVLRFIGPPCVAVHRGFSRGGEPVGGRVCVVSRASILLTGTLRQGGMHALQRYALQRWQCASRLLTDGSKRV